jgi:hypothetical protein
MHGERPTLTLIQRPADPVPYSDEVANAICDAIVCGSRGLAYLCATQPGFPCYRTARRWIAEKPDFRAMYDEAKMLQADLLFDEIIEIADNDSEDVLIITRNDGRQVRTLNREFVQRSDLMVRAREKVCAKLNPRKYGEKLDVNATLGFIPYEQALAQLA